MEVLKRSWTQIRAALEGLTRAEKGFIISLMVIGVMALGMLLWYASQPETVVISQFASGRVDEVRTRLNAAGIDARIEGGQLRVPVAQQNEAIALLVQGDLLTDDASAAFNAMIVNQSPWTTDKQGERAYLIAKQTVLANIIRKMRGVRMADVVISMPQDKGFGHTFDRPSASVSVALDGSRSVKPIVPAVAALVAGSVAEMKPQDVSVVDANTGQTHTVRDRDDVLPTDKIQLVERLERQKREQIERLLRYIPNVIVAVNVRTDTIHKQQDEQFDYSKTEPLRREHVIERISRNIAQQGEPGVRPNTGMDINGANASGSEETLNETESEFGDKQLVKRSHITRTGLNTQQINVTVNVPRGYFVSLFKSANPDVAQPTDEQLQPVVDRQLKKIEAQIEPLIAAESTGVIAAHMIPDETVLPAIAGVAPASGFESIVSSGWVGPVGVTLLALLSLALMLGMVRKATQPESLPSVEELAGVPPTLPSEDDLVGEVEEQESSMQGLELDEDELKSRHMAEQISELIKANPSEASHILSKWVGADDY